MSTSVTLPALGESVTEGTVSRWLKAVGDRVEADEPLLEVSTDKVDTEIPSPTAGVLLEIKAEEDETVEVGAELAVIGEEGEGGDSGSDSSGETAEPEAESAETESAEAEQPAADESGADEAPAEQPAAESKAKPAKKSSGGGGTEVTLPELGESVTEGTVSRWLKSVGDRIEVDEALVEISTDKVDTEVPSPIAGTVLEIKVSEDDSIDVGGVLAIVGEAEDGESAEDDSDSDDGSDSEPKRAAESDSTSDAATVNEPEDQTAAGDEGGQEPMPAPAQKPAESKPAEKPAESKSAESKPAESKPSEKSASESAGNPASARPSSRVGGADDSEGSYVTPLVRKLAAEHKVDLTSLSGTGVGGRIRKQDVLAAAEVAKKAAAAPAPVASAPAKPDTSAATEPSPDAAAKRGTTEKLSRMRKTIAKRMTESLQVSAQLTATVEVDLTSISRIRAVAKDDFKKREGASLSYLPFIAKAAIETLRQIPKVNATIDTEAGTVTYSDSEDIGIAVDTDKGLMVPVIKDAGDFNIGGLAKKIGDLASRTRGNKITPDELTGGTFTITNYGSAGTLFDTPIINQPQVAILGTGALVKRPMVMTDKNLGDTIAVRDMMYLSMTYDHRLVDGADAARFLAAVKERLEEGDFGGEFGV